MTHQEKESSTEAATGDTTEEREIRIGMALTDTKVRTQTDQITGMALEVVLIEEVKSEGVDRTGITAGLEVHKGVHVTTQTSVTRTDRDSGNEKICLYVLQ